MAQFNSKLLATHLEIGLSKEDEAKLQAMRTGKVLAGKFSLSGAIKKINTTLATMTKIKLQEKVTFFQLLAVMINAGVPLIRSLKVLAHQDQNPRFKKIINDLATEMEKGQPLSESMGKYAWLFTESDRGMIASGEASGNLNSILNDIARQTEKNALIVSKVKGAMIYPIAIVLIMIAALALMLTMVVPKITELFTQGGQELPLTTQILINSSEFTQANWDIMGLFAIAVFTGIYFFRRSKRGQYLTDYMFIKMPIFGTIMRQVLIARFARMLASLMLAGIPIVKALDINANAVGNAVYKKRIQFAAQDVAQGIQLGENMRDSEFLFPPMVASMVLIGEQTANLTEVSQKIADYYDGQVDNAIKSLSKLMEPVILVVMGLIIGFIVAAIMQPIMALSDISSVV